MPICCWYAYSHRRHHPFKIHPLWASHLQYSKLCLFRSLSNRCYRNTMSFYPWTRSWKPSNWWTRTRHPAGTEFHQKRTRHSAIRPLIHSTVLFPASEGEDEMPAEFRDVVIAAFYKYKDVRVGCGNNKGLSLLFIVEVACRSPRKTILCCAFVGVSACGCVDRNWRHAYDLQEEP